VSRRPISSTSRWSPWFDTNCDPDPINYPVRPTTTRFAAIKLMAGKMADAVIEGLQMRRPLMRLTGRLPTASLCTRRRGNSRRLQSRGGEIDEYLGLRFWPSLQKVLATSTKGARGVVLWKSLLQW